MALHPLAGQPAPKESLIDVAKLENEFFTRQPDVSVPAQRVSFGTSGHRGTSLDGCFTEAHILAITQAICEYRQQQKIDGPLFLGRDTHALSRPAQRAALEVLAANSVHTIVQEADGFTPTPVISHAILAYNRGRKESKADGIIITPSHNPPQDGGFKYNPPHGGPADTDVTTWIETRANELLQGGNSGVRKMPYALAIRAATTHQQNFVRGYVADLGDCIDFRPIREAKLKIGVDPLGGSAVHYWGPIAERYGIDITVVNPAVSPAFEFMTVDHDGQIRMDCSSPYAMASLVKLKDSYGIAFGNDPDADRHGIVTPSAGLLNPNHFLAVAIRYLFTYRDRWLTTTAIGKTLVSSGIIDRVARELGRTVIEVPVGFKWFVAGLHQGTLGFGGEESAGASFLRRDGTVWTTDKDGLIMGLLAAEITARTGKDPGQHFKEIAALHGQPYYRRVDQPATPTEKSILKKLTPDAVQAGTLAGEPILAKLTAAPGNNAAIGGLKVVAANGWFAARPSGTENVYKIYAESFKEEQHLEQILAEARQIVEAALRLGVNS
jgi:phosphoglucomutase